MLSLRLEDKGFERSCLVPTFETVFVLACHYAVSKLCNVQRHDGMSHHNEVRHASTRRHTSPHSSVSAGTFTIHITRAACAVIKYREGGVAMREWRVSSGACHAPSAHAELNIVTLDEKVKPYTTTGACRRAT